MNTYLNEPKITIDDIDDQLITDITTYNARSDKYRAIVVSTDANPDTTGWAEPTLLFIYS